MKKYKEMALIISAPSGTGKTTLIKKLTNEVDYFEFVVSTTSRTIRDGEVAGKSYYYVSDKDFKRSIENGDFLEWAQVHGNYYGTSKKEIDRITSLGKIPLFDIDVQGAKSLKSKLEYGIYILIVPPSIEALKERLVNRKTDSLEQIDIRLNNAKKELQDYSYYDYIIINDIVSDALGRLKSVIDAELIRTPRMKDYIHKIIE